MAAPERFGDREQLPTAARALVEAAKSLLARRAPSAITGRALAQEAGVNYGLLHRHFGGKAAALGAAFDELSADFAADAFGGPDVAIPLRLETHSAFLNAATRMALDRAGFDDLHHRSPVVERYLERMRSHRPDLDLTAARTSVAVGSSISLGLAIHRRTIAPTVGLTPDDPLIEQLAGRWLVGLQEGHGPLGVVLVATPSRRCALNPPTNNDVSGREAMEAKLVSAGATLLSDREPSAISGRSLARAAGVNYGLIHHYFGTKDEVLRQSIQLHRDRFFAATAGAGRGPAFFSPSDHPGYVRAITRAALDGDLRADDARYPVVANMLDVLTEPGMDPGHERAVRVAIAAVVAAQLAWALFTPMLEQGLGVALADLEPWAASMLRELLRSPLSGTTGQG